MSDEAYHRAGRQRETARRRSPSRGSPGERVPGQGRCGFNAGKITAAERNALHAGASDSRAALHRECSQWHADGLAAIQRHFGQQITSRGNPDADHAIVFVAEHDPDGQFAPIEAPSPIGRVVEIDYNGIKRVVWVDSNGRVVAYAEPIVGDGWSNRGAFAGGRGSVSPSQACRLRNGQKSLT